MPDQTSTIILQSLGDVRPLAGRRRVTNGDYLEQLTYLIFLKCPTSTQSRPTTVRPHSGRLRFGRI